MIDSLIVAILSSNVSPSKTWEYRLKAQESRTYQYGRLPNPKLSYDLDPDYHIFGVSQEILNPRIVFAERRMAEADLRGVTVGNVLDSINFVYRIKVFYYDALYDLEMVRIQEERLNALDSLLKVVERGRRIGRFSAADLYSIRSKREHVLGELMALRESFKASIGFLEDMSGLKLEGIEPEEVAPLPTVDSLAPYLNRSPFLLSYTYRLQRLRAERQLHGAYRFPSMEIFFGGVRYPTPPQWAITLSLSLPVPLFNDNRGNIKGTEYELKSTLSDSAYAHRELMRRAVLLLDRYRALWKKYRRLKEVEIPSMRKAYEETLKLYKVGALSYTAVFVILDDLYSRMEELAGVRLKLHTTLADLERLTLRRLRR